MPYPRPTLPDLIAQAEADIESRLPGTDAKVRRTNLNVLARIVAAGLHGLYGFVAWLARQVMPDTADADYLARWASIWLSTPRVPAEFAGGTVIFTGTDGAYVPATTVLQRADGVRFETVTAGVVAGGQVSLQVVAVEAGQAGNTLAGARLSLVTPVAGLAGSGIVAAGALTAGADAETDDALRARLLARIRKPPQGGAAADYLAWALEVPGVTRAWVFSAQAGEVDLFFVRDADLSPIPDAAEVADVQDWIDARRPVTALFTARAPVPDAVPFTIHLVPDTPAVRAAVAAELADFFMREASPGATLPLSRIREAVSLAAGERDSVVSVPSADVVSAPGHMATLGAVTWV